MNAVIAVKKAVLLSALHTFLYVGILYLREASRPSTTKNKDIPSVIKARIAAVSIALILSIFSNRYIIEQARQSGQRTGIQGWDNILGGWGEWKLDFNQTFLAWRLTALLFLGPLVERIWIEEGWKRIGGGLSNALTSLTGWRNYIIVRFYYNMVLTPRDLHQKNLCFVDV
jgi:prenyl protein peptidase